jgi:CRP-like cAMP-binding protein
LYGGLYEGWETGVTFLRQVVRIAEFGVGQSIGELALMGEEHEAMRTATCVALTACSLGVLHRDVYQRAILQVCH